jgi:multidrug efflux pump subunit AcrA (membrane-fusion protein)
MAQMDSLQLAFMTPNQRLIKELELEKASIEKARYEKKIVALKAIQQFEIRRLQLEIQRFSLNIQQLKEYIDALTLTSPKSGLFIVGTNPRTGLKFKPGDQAFANFPIGTIPQFDEMKVKIMAPEADFKVISVNDSVFYSFDAMPGNSGVGKILKKSPMGQSSPQIVMVSGGMVMMMGGRQSTVKFFEIEASIDSAITIPEPGFSANCRVTLKQIDSVISIPQIAVFDDDSIKIVYVQRKNGFEKRQVLTGTSSLRESVITAGLQEGEIIALSKPKYSMVKGLIALPDSLTQKPEPPDATPTPENRQGIPPGVMPNLPPGIIKN